MFYGCSQREMLLAWFRSDLHSPVGDPKLGVRFGSSRNRDDSAVAGVTLGEGAMTVAELIEMLAALPDKTARVVKSPGPWDGLNEPSDIQEGYLDRELQFPVQANDPGAIHVVYL